MVERKSEVTSTLAEEGQADKPAQALGTCEEACEEPRQAPDARRGAYDEDGPSYEWREGGRDTFTCEPCEGDEDGDLWRYDPADPVQLTELGRHIAARYLRAYGYRILERGWRGDCGEVDLVCKKDDTVVLAHVRTRHRAESLPEDEVSAGKLRRYRRVALAYIAEHEWFEDVRTDVLAINVAEGNLAQVHHFIGVCTWEG